MERQGRESLGNGVLAVGISHSLPLDSRFIQGTHPLFFVQPHIHTGQSLGGGGSLVVRERSDRAGSSSFSGLLQPAVCGDKGLRVVEAGHQPLATESDGSEDFFQDEDSLVCSLGAERGLDGVYRLEGCVLASSDAFGKPQAPQIHSVRDGVSVQSSLLWAFHGSVCLHAGHGSAFGFSSPVRHSSSSFPRRLADPSVLPGAGSSCSGHHFLDDWLIQASSLVQVLLALDTVLHLCHSLGIVVNWEKSQLVPAQRMMYLGVLLDSLSFRASPAQKRVEKLFSIGYVFLSCEERPVSSWLELLGVLSSMIQLVPVGRLRMRSLQLVLRRSWDHCDQSALVS